MAKFSKDGISKLSEMTSIRNNFNKYNIEIQLVWLYELLLLKVLTDKIRRNDLTHVTSIGKFYTYYPHDAIDMLGCIGFNEDCLDNLKKYRNKYVHTGTDSAYEMFVPLYVTYRESLIELANYVDVRLNFDISLYVRIEKRGTDLLKRKDV